MKRLSYSAPRSLSAAALAVALAWGLSWALAASVSGQTHSGHGHDPQAKSHDGSDHHDHDHDEAGHTHGEAGAAEDDDAPAVPTWEPEGENLGIGDLSMEFTDQEGQKGNLSELVDRPVLLTFFYSRCQNSRKCPMTISRLAALQKRLAGAGFDNRVRLLAVTFEPQFDTPERLKRYAVNRGLALGANARALRFEADDQQALVDDLRVPVSYNAGWVNGHGVELNLLDAEGRLVRKYHSVLWTGPRVVDDLRHLLDGESAAATVADTR